MMRIQTTIAAGMVFVASWTLATEAVAQPNHPSKVNLTFDRFYDYDDMVAALNMLANAYSNLLTLESIGKSTEDTL